MRRWRPPLGRSILLAVAAERALDGWLSGLEAFHVLRAGDLTAAATLARRCRPDLLLLHGAWSGGLPPDRRERFPDSLLGWLVHGLRRRIALARGRDPIAAARGRGYRLA